MYHLQPWQNKSRFGVFSRLLVGAILMLALCPHLPAASHGLLLGDAERGRDLLHSQGCAKCHRGPEGRLRNAPDLTKLSARGFAPYELAGAIWNHAPGMWRAMAAEGLELPELTSQQAADLFAFFYASTPFEEKGNQGRGRRVFAEKNCGACHGIVRSLPGGILPVSRWKSVRDPAELALRSWEHGGDMKAAALGKGLPSPELSAQQMTDLVAYVRRVCIDCGSFENMVLGGSETGRELVERKGCLECHRGSLNFGMRPTRYGLKEFAAAMWNHSFQVAGEHARLTYGEMRRITAYLVSAQFYEEKGSEERGREVYAIKGCAKCHDQPSSGAPSLASRSGRLTSYDMIEVLWKHGPEMYRRMQAMRMNWPRFSGSEMADLTAFLHGPEFKRR